MCFKTQIERDRMEKIPYALVIGKVVKNAFLTRHETYNINSDCKLET